MTNIINLADKMEEAERAKSTHVMTLDVYKTPNGEIWAKTYADEERSRRDDGFLMLKLAWYAFRMDAEARNDGAPLACITVFDDRLISTRWDEELIATEEQLAWLKDQVAVGLEDIQKSVEKTKRASRS